jgi:hypothetical protein
VAADAATAVDVAASVAGAVKKLRL